MEMKYVQCNIYGMIRTPELVTVPASPCSHLTNCMQSRDTPQSHLQLITRASWVSVWHQRNHVVTVVSIPACQGDL